MRAYVTDTLREVEKHPPKLTLQPYDKLVVQAEDGSVLEVHVEPDGIKVVAPRGHYVLVRPHVCNVVYLQAEG